MELLPTVTQQQTTRACAFRRGFTLIELIVVMAIILVITSITLVSQTTFNRTLVLTDTAYTVALSIRETQSLGLASQKFVTSSNSIIQNAGYGIHFETDTPTSYLQFADVANTSLSQTSSYCPVGTAGMPDAKPGDCLYDGATEMVQKYSFSQGFIINNFCAYSGTNNTLIGCSSSGSSLYGLDIVYQRPNTNAIISAVFTNGTVMQATTACVQIAAPGGNSRYIEMTQLGEVSVVNSCP